MSDEYDDGSDGEPQGGLGSLSMMYRGSSMPGAATLDKMIEEPLVPESNKWLRFAAGALAPTGSGSFGASLGNAVSGYAGAQSEEAALKARYLPIVAQALLMRQQQAMQLQMNQNKLVGDWDNAITGQLTGLLTLPQITPDAINGVMGALVRQGRVPLPFAQQYYQNIPKDPDAARSYIRSKAVGAMSDDQRLGVVTPKVEARSPDAGTLPFNTNPNASVPVGAMPGGVPSQLTPSEKLPKTLDTPQGPRVFAPTTGKSAIVGTPEAQAVVQEGMGVPPQGVPGTAPPGGPGAPGLPGGGGTPQPPPLRGPAPSTSAGQNITRNKADEVSGTDFAKYEDNINAEVTQLANLAFRTEQSRKYLQQFRTGATADIRSKGAAFAKDFLLSMGISASEANAIGNGIAGGDLAAAQAFQKLSIQGSMEALKVAAGAGQRFTQAEFQQFQKANPNLDLDPKAIEKINNFVMENYRRVVAEQEFIANEKDKGVPIEKIRVNWERKRRELDQHQPRRELNKAMGTSGPKTSERLGNSASNRPMKLGPSGVWEYDEE